jgi:hypothetical protein
MGNEIPALTQLIGDQTRLASPLDEDGGRGTQRRGDFVILDSGFVAGESLSRSA